MFLVGDIGGTYTRLALIKGSGKNIIYEKSFLTKDFKTLEKVLGSFLKENRVPLLAACFGVAGVVRRGKCVATNFPWAVDISVLRKFLKIEKVFLISDLQAKACGLSLLEERDFLVVNEGQFELGNAAIVAPGTGLGVAGLAFGGERNIPFATEAGHVDFAPRNEMEAQLLFYLQKKYENVSCERVISGMGIYNIYRFLVDEGFEAKEKIVEAEVLKNDPPVVIYKLTLRRSG